MNILRHSPVAVLLAASLAASPCATAADDNVRDDAHGGFEHGVQRPHDDFGGHGPGGPGPDKPSGHGLRGLRLTDAQQDKLFALRHAAAPQRREQDKAIRKARETLRELGRAERFDDARAAAAARDLGQAAAAQALGEARLRAQTLAVLTAEQREQLRRGRADGGPGPAGDGPGQGAIFR